MFISSLAWQTIVLKLDNSKTKRRFQVSDVNLAKWRDEFGEWLAGNRLAGPRGEEPAGGDVRPSARRQLMERGPGGAAKL